MKKHFTFLGFLLGILITTLSSCSTTQTFTVRGVPGTVISKDNMQIAVIDPSGQAQITLQRKNGYEHFLLKLLILMYRYPLPWIIRIIIELLPPISVLHYRFQSTWQH